MDALVDAAVILVDHPASQEDARARTSRLRPKAGRLTLVAADLGQGRLAEALAGAHDPSTPTTWVWEGVSPYLTREDVGETISAIAAQSAPRGVLVLTHQTRSLVNTLGRRTAQLAARLAGRGDPLADEPWRSLWSPDAMGRALHERGSTFVRIATSRPSPHWSGRRRGGVARCLPAGWSSPNGGPTSRRRATGTGSSGSRLRRRRRRGALRGRQTTR
jgi:O-methyltransferase involved in polyketide biosynthesis